MIEIKELSPREVQIVDLCIAGHTNEGIANTLGISFGSVNSYWLRIKLKVGGSGRTETIARIVESRAEIIVQDAKLERKHLAEIIAKKEHTIVELRAALALMQLAMDQLQSLVWATDLDLTVQLIGNIGHSNPRFGGVWEVGRTIFELFGTDDREQPAIAAHLAALVGKETKVQLTGELKDLCLIVSPLPDDSGETIGCISLVYARRTRNDSASSN